MKAYPIIAGVTFGLPLAVLAPYGTLAHAEKIRVFSPFRVGLPPPIPLWPAEIARPWRCPSMRTPRCIMNGLEAVPKYLATQK